MWSFDSRMALVRYLVRRSAEIASAPAAVLGSVQVAARVCHRNSSVPPSSSAGRSSEVAARSSPTQCSHSRGYSVRTASRARTSSLRFVSWVDRVVMLVDQSAARVRQKPWKSSWLMPMMFGSEPTSLTPMNRFHR